MKKQAKPQKAAQKRIKKAFYFARKPWIGFRSTSRQRAGHQQASGTVKKDLRIWY